jgi:deazaflavin-dependent oxidoreductase (nitroreductase family)
VPSDAALKAMNAVHRLILGITGGRKGWTVASMPALELTTTGRRTGNKHTVLLTSPVQEGTTWVVVASRGGDDQTPAWYLNLCAHPEVEASLQGRPAEAMLARTATGEERARLWPLVTAAYKGYATYQTRTQREIPLVLLDPVA